MTWKYDKVFLTGSDRATEWMLPWFMKHFKLRGHKNLVFADFGVSSKARDFMQNNCLEIIDLKTNEEKGWFKKPMAMLKCPSKYTVWVDTDCQFKHNCEEIFNLIKPNKLLMGHDRPWIKRSGEIWHNSGVVGFVDKPIILEKWVEEVRVKPIQGDQETLHYLLDPLQKLMYIEDLHNMYNVLRLQIDTDGYTGKRKILHWTGYKGKLEIRKMIRE